MEQLEKQLEMLDSRLDHIDTVVTELVQRVMRQPITIEVSCPKCNSPIAITLTGNVKLGAKAARSYQD